MKDDPEKRRQNWWELTSGWLCYRKSNSSHKLWKRANKSILDNLSPSYLCRIVSSYLRIYAGSYLSIYACTHAHAHIHINARTYNMMYFLYNGVGQNWVDTSNFLNVFWEVEQIIYFFSRSVHAKNKSSVNLIRDTNKLLSVISHVFCS